MPKIDSEIFYTNAIKKFGTTARGVQWLSKENQLVRFDALIKFLPKKIDSYSLVDAGCGFADLFVYLEHKKLCVNSYIGIDIHSEMCKVARKKTAQKIIHADISKESIPKADYYLCSGALNILTVFETYLFIQNCYKSSKKAFIFNTLYANDESQTYNYLTKEKIEKIAKELDVYEVAFIEGYLLKDITVCFKHKESE